MKNKAYDLEFWRKPGESDAETRERLYRQCKTDKIYFGFDNLITVFDEAANAFWDTVKAVCYLFIAVPIVFFAAPYYIGRAIILRYLILLRIGAITWYGKRTERIAPNRFKPGDIVYAKIYDSYEYGAYILAKVRVLDADNNVEILDEVISDYGVRINLMEPYFVNNWNMWATIEEAEKATGAEYKFKQN